MTLGTALAFVLVAVAVACVRVVWSSPLKGLGLLVAGMTVHNAFVMVLVNWNTPIALVRFVQGWKELLLLALAILAARTLLSRRRTGKPLSLLWSDWLALAFAALVVTYGVIGTIAYPDAASLPQRFVSARLSLLMPVLYAFGRIFWRDAADLAFSRRLIVASAAFVGLFGLVELWFVPTARWVDWGAVELATWMGFEYSGPLGLPENFFHSTSAGLFLRRLVSTHVSPLGVAYTGLLVVPLAMQWIGVTHRRWVGAALGAATALVVAGILFSVTRLALACLVVEMILLAFVTRSRRIFWAAAITAGAVFLVLYQYPSVGPVLSADLVEMESPTRSLRTADVPEPQDVGATDDTDEDTNADTNAGEMFDRVLSQDDPSVRGHVDAILYGVRYVLAHPLGTGLGSAIPRYGETQGPGESALLRIGGELGILGAAIYAALYLGVVWSGIRAYSAIRPDSEYRSFALVALAGGIALFPVMLTSDVWGNFSVTFLFWWTAGLTATAAQQRHTGAVGSP